LRTDRWKMVLQKITAKTTLTFKSLCEIKSSLVSYSFKVVSSTSPSSSDRNMSQWKGRSVWLIISIGVLGSISHHLLVPVFGRPWGLPPPLLSISPISMRDKSIYTDAREGDGEPRLSGSLKLLSTAQRTHTVSLSQPPSFINPLVSLESSQKCCTTLFSQDSACSSRHRPLYQM